MHPARTSWAPYDKGELVTTTKDRNKDGFFQRNFDQLPQVIQEKFKTAKTGAKRDLVNDVVVRDPQTGQWYINIQSAVLKEWQEKYIDVRKDKGLVTKPPGIAASMYGGWAGLADAEKRKEVWRVVHDGQEYYQWREFTEVEREGHRGGVTTSGTRKLDQASYKVATRALMHWGCSLDLTPTAIAGTPTKSIKGMSVDLSAKVLENLGKVQKACDRAISDGKGVFRRIDELGVADNTAKALGVKMKADIEATPSQDIVPDPH